MRRSYLAFVTHPVKGIDHLYSPNKLILHTIVRIVFVLATTAAMGFLFFGSSIFMLTRPPSQFLTSGITAALFYAFAKTSSLRNALAAILVWYVVSSLFDVHNSWLFVLFLVYIAGISSVVYFYLLLIKKPAFDGVFQRLATFSLLTGMMNALAVLLLSLFSATFGHMQLHFLLQVALDNFQLGTLIGLGLGAGIEITETLLALKSVRQFI